MVADPQIVLLFGSLHLVALVSGGLLFYLFLRSETVETYQPPDDDEGDGGGGGNDRLREPPKPPRPGGIPLPDAEQSTRRLRGPGRIADGRRLTRRTTHPRPRRAPDRV